MVHSRKLLSPDELALNANSNVTYQLQENMERSGWITTIVYLSNWLNDIEHKLKSFGVLLKDQGIQKFDFKSGYYRVFSELGDLANKISDPTFFETTLNDRQNITTAVTMSSLLHSNVELLKLSVKAAWMFYSSMADFVPLDEEERYLDLYDDVQLIENGVDILSDVTGINEMMTPIIYHGGYPDDLQISIDLLTNKYHKTNRIFHTFFSFDDRP